MAYGDGVRFKIDLKYSNTNNPLTASSMDLFILARPFTEEPVDSETVYLGGVVEGPSMWREVFTVEVYPFKFVEHEAEMDALRDVLDNYNHFWINSGGEYYPLTFVNVKVTITAREWETNKEEGTKILTLTMKRVYPNG